MNTRYYQWLSGEKKGSVVTFSNIDEEDDSTFLEFTDGTRCNIDFVAPLDTKDPSGKHIVEVTDPQNVWRFTTKTVGEQKERWEKDANDEMQCVVPYIAGTTIEIPIPPKTSLSILGFKREISPVVKEVPEQHSPIVSEVSFKTPEVEVKISNEKDDLSSCPIYILFKNAKKHDTKVELSLDIDLPGKTLYNMIKEDFTDDKDKLFEYIINSVSIESIKTSLKEAIKIAYEE